MNILSIQSWVAYGHVGNASAMFPMQRLGHEVWAVNTVQFSNHTGYGAWKGQVFSGEAIREVVDGVAERGVLPTCDGVLSGYMGDASIGEAVLDAVARVKAANPKALYCCDPVIGDVGRGVFVRPGIPEFMKERCLPAADIITPNHFELELLAGHEAKDAASFARALDTVHRLGPKIIVVTSLHADDTPDGMLDLVVSASAGRFRVRTPLLPVSVNGAGDAIAALFFVHYLDTKDAAEALGRAASSVYGLLKRTAEAGSREILSVAAQDEFVAPTTRFTAEKI
jgi:pyridoxine kinase